MQIGCGEFCEWNEELRKGGVRIGIDSCESVVGRGDQAKVIGQQRLWPGGTRCRRYGSKPQNGISGVGEAGGCPITFGWDRALNFRLNRGDECYTSPWRERPHESSTLSECV